MNDHSLSEEELFEAVREIDDPRERATVLEVCAADAELRRRVEKLLSFRSAADELFRPLPALHEPPVASASPAWDAGAVIGRYKLLEKIGEGGFGVVYVAEQGEPVKRRVALKIIKLGMDTGQVVARFEAERQALALMDHPNIAKVHDGGATETGRPYFVMELIRGVPITQYCEQNQPSITERLELFLQVCQAVQHAHQKGIIHRDLKPSNILVTLNDNVPVPKVIDFGIAKATQAELTDKTLVTQCHHFIGTPAYVSPEQVGMTGSDIDTRSDIYSLGVLLYELLTGGTPFDGKELLASGLDEMRRTIREKEPLKPSAQLSHRQVPRTSSDRIRRPTIDTDLDCIVLKCLEKDRSRRYTTANDLAADLRRYLQNEPILARPASRAYRLRKTISLHRTASIAVAVVVLALTAAAVISTWGFVRERAAKRRERVAQERTQKQLRAALAFVEDVFERVEPQISTLAGAAKAQDELGSAGIRFMDHLAQAGADEPTLHLALVKVLLKASDSQNPGNANTVGDYETGLKRAQEAVALLNANPALLPSPQHLDLLCRGELAIAQCFAGLGRYDEAVTHWNKLDPLLKQLEEVPASAQWAARQRVGVLVSVGYSRALSGHPQEAIDHLLLVFKTPWARGLTNTSRSYELETLANAHDNIASAYGLLGRFEEMAQSAAEGERIWKRLVERHPDNARYLIGRAISLSQQGFVLARTEQIDAGEALLQNSRQMVEALLAQDTSNELFRLARVIIATHQARALARRDRTLTEAEQKQRLSQAQQTLSEAEKFSESIRSNEAEMYLNAARAEVAAAAK